MRIYELFVPKKTEKYIRQLCDAKEAQNRIRSLGNKKAALFLTVVLISLVISVPLFVSDMIRSSLPVTIIDRNEPGKGSRTVPLHVAASDGYEGDITVDVDERSYTDEEIEKMSAELDSVLWKEILGDNIDPENILYDLKLPARLEGYPFNITWKSSDPLVVGSNGKVNSEALKKKDEYDNGINIQLCATLKYKDHTEDKYSYIVVRKAGGSAGGRRADMIERAVSESSKATGWENYQTLPKEAGGKHLTFYNRSSGRGWAVIFLGTILAFLIMASKDEKIKKEAMDRKRQIEHDHPEILNRYMLYYMAGMNPRAIWYEICSSYEQNGKNQNGRRYAFEEMVRARNRMEEGCGELSAYDAFAERCDDIRFRTFISFVKQAVVTGGDGLCSVLYEEMDKAYRDKMGQIKVSASEAETKLLLPMFMMLAVVLTIVMVPAFIGLNG